MASFEIHSLPSMRIATWNLERPDPADVARNQARLEKIREVGADLWILTETHEVIDLSDTHHGAATTPSARKPLPGESCATVWSRWQILRRVETSEPSEAVCVEVAHPDGPLLVYGSIIAYAGYKGPDGKSQMWEEHYRYIEWHGSDWKRLQAEDRLHVVFDSDPPGIIRSIMIYLMMQGAGGSELPQRAARFGWSPAPVFPNIRLA